MKRSPMRKYGKSPRQKQQQICDYLWGTIVIARDKKCVYCKVNDATHPHHIFAKGECPTTRWDIRIGIGLCGGCHQFKAHANPEAYREINIRHCGGKPAYDRLFIMASVRTAQKKDLQLIEMSLWQDAPFEKPEDWDEKSHTAKITWLRNIRRKHG